MMMLTAKTYQKLEQIAALSVNSFSIDNMLVFGALLEVGANKNLGQCAI